MRIRLRLCHWLLMLGIALTLAVSTPAGAQNSKQFGKWILRATLPTTGTREYEDRGCGLILSTRQGTNAQGVPYFTQYAAKVDGKEYPRLVKGANTVGTIQWDPIDAYSNAYTLREDGKLTGSGVTTVSKDGKVLTVTSKGLNGRVGAEIYDRAP